MVKARHSVKNFTVIFFIFVLSFLSLFFYYSDFSSVVNPYDVHEMVIIMYIAADGP